MINRNINMKIVPLFMTMALLFIGMSGIVNAADVGTSTDTDGGLEIQTLNSAPSITGFDILNAGYTSILDAQVDVNTEITVNVTIEDTNGWDTLDTVQIMCWYDGGSEGYFPDQTTGHNYRVLLYYDNTAAGGNGESVPTTANMDAKYSTSVDHSTVTDGTHAVSEITANCKYKLTWKFTPSYQLKQANIPSAADGTAFANANSWNIMINATDEVTTTSQKDSGTDAYEFGIYKYTYVSSASNTWDVGTVAMNSNSDATAASVTTRSNDDMDLSVWINADLARTSPSDTIPTSGSYVKILAATSASDDIGSDLTFTANGEGGEKIILADTGYGDHSDYMASNSALTTSVNFNIAVPIGTMPGTYTAGLTFQVSQVA